VRQPPMQHRRAAWGRRNDGDPPAAEAQLASTRRLVKAKRQGWVPRPVVKAQNGDLRRPRVDREANRRWPSCQSPVKVSGGIQRQRVAGGGGMVDLEQWHQRQGSQSCRWSPALIRGLSWRVILWPCWASAAAGVLPICCCGLSPQALATRHRWRSFHHLGDRLPPAGRRLACALGACVGLSAVAAGC